MAVAGRDGRRTRARMSCRWRRRRSTLSRALPRTSRLLFPAGFARVKDGAERPACGLVGPSLGWTPHAARLGDGATLPPWRTSRPAQDLRDRDGGDSASRRTSSSMLLNHVSGTRAGVAGIYNRHDYQPRDEGGGRGLGAPCCSGWWRGGRRQRRAAGGAMSDAVSEDYLRRELEMLAARSRRRAGLLHEPARRHADGRGQAPRFASVPSRWSKAVGRGPAAPPPNSSRPSATLRTCSPSKA